jgi:RimJ/RimL family protein N-acetyltransferase
MEHLVLRPLTQDDLPFVAEVRHHPETLPWLHDSRVFSLEEMHEWYRRTRPPWLIILHDGRPAGYFRVSDVDIEHKSIKIGADIHPDLRRRGIATAAYRQFLRELLDYGWRRVWLEVLEDNETAIRLYRRLGFREEGRRPHATGCGQRWRDSIVMSLLNPRVTGRSVKVIVLYLGDRRASPANAREALPMLRFLLEKERTVDPGEKLDTLLIYHRIDPTASPASRPYVEEAEALLRDADGSATHSGCLRVLVRPNIGLSFGAYNFAFSLFADAYDYWLFTEDDQIMVKDGYLRKAIGQLEQDTNIGFVALVGVSQSVFHPHHAHGGVGVAPRTVLQRVKAANPSPTHPEGHLPYHVSDGYANQELLGEICFTNAIDRLGYRLVDLDDEEVVVAWGQSSRRTPRMTPWREEMAVAAISPVKRGT